MPERPSSRRLSRRDGARRGHPAGVAETTGGSYHPASDVAQLDGIASTINLRLTTHNENVPLAGAFVAFAVVLLAAGSILTVLRTGRVV